MSDVKTVLKNILACLAALCIPVLLIMDALQARKYADLQRQVRDLEKRQEDLVEQNKKLITDISVLSSADRIETIARDELGMRSAESDEIIRVEMKDKNK